MIYWIKWALSYNLDIIVCMILSLISFYFTATVSDRKEFERERKKAYREKVKREFHERLKRALEL